MSILASTVLKAFPQSKDMLKGKRPQTFGSMNQHDSRKICSKLGYAIDQILDGSCHQKTVNAPAINKGDSCSCSGANGNAQAVVDLVVLIDTSGSMKAASTNISNAATAAIAQVSKSCPTDLREHWFGLEGTWVGTRFLTTSRSYLINLPGVGPGSLTTSTSEDGAKGVADLANHYDWREGACRAILYIGDEGMEAGDPHNAADDAAVTQAIADANANNVQVFTHYVGTPSNTAKIASYQSLALNTNGKFFNGPATVSDYETLLTDVICNACGTCKHAPIDDIEPCLSVSWGDGDCDSIETSDFEKICITACNCYDNITFKNLTIKAIMVLDASGKPVATLPDGTPSVDITPLGPVCFGDIEPCTQEGASCVSRQVVLQTCGAIPGDYLIAVFYCYEGSFHRAAAQGYKIELCAS